LKIPLFVGRDQVVLFEFSGVEKLKLLPDLVKLFERLVGAKLRWGAVRDSDANVPEIKAKHCEVAQQMGIPVFHQWSQYGIENYLLDPPLLLAALKRKKPEVTLDVPGVEALLDQAIASIEDDVSGVFVTKTQTAYRTFEMNEKPFDAGATAATRYLRSVTTR